MKKYQYVFLLCLICSGGFSQQFGQHPTGINWKSMNSESSKIIFPEGMESQAQRISNIVFHLDKNNRRSVGTKSRKFEMVLQNRSVFSNGFVRLAPFYSEFFITPPQSNSIFGSTDFVDLLAIHEYRHAQQISNTRNGLTKLGYYVAGQRGWSFLTFLAIPNFYFEGDAVVMETALTESGRGRIPDFTKEQRALALSDASLTYQQMRNGSFKRMIPDHYRWGYMMQKYIRNEYGNDKPRSILKTASSYGLPFGPYNASHKKYINIGTKKLFRKSWENAKLEWTEQLSEVKLRPTKSITKPSKEITHYSFPQFVGNRKILAIKESFDKTDELVLIRNRKIEKLTNIGHNFNARISHNKNVVAWTELGIDSRWGNETYSNIVTYNLKTKKKLRLSEKSKLFSPAVSPDGDKIAVVNISLEQESSIWILNAKTGAVLNKIKNSENSILSRIAWSEDEKSIVAVSKKNNKLSLLKFNFQKGNVEHLIQPTSHVVDNPHVKNGRVYFNGSFTGIDNIFSTDLAGDSKIYQETSVKIAAKQPVVSQDGKTLAFTDFTKDGTMLSKVELYDSVRTVFNVVEPNEMSFWQSANYLEEGGNILDSVEEVATKTKKYKGLFKDMKLHSWRFWVDGDFGRLELPVQNLRNDVLVNFKGVWDDQGSHQYQVESTFGRTFLPIGVTGGYSTVIFEDDLGKKERAGLATLGTNISLPLQRIRGNYLTRFEVSMAGLANRVVFNNLESINLSDENTFVVESNLNFSNLRRTAVQNVGPRGGQRFNLKYERNILNGSNHQLQADFSLYFPGFLPNHAVKLSGGYLNKFGAVNNQFINNQAFTRGYEFLNGTGFSKIGIDYGLPLLYPDLGLLRFIYLKRIRANLFFEYGRRIKNFSNQKTDFSSTGIELIFDQQVLNFLPSGLGVRGSYLLNQDLFYPDRKYNFEVVFNTIF